MNQAIELQENDKNNIKDTMELNVSNDLGNGAGNGTMKTSKEEEAKELSITYPFFCSVRFLVITLLGFLGSMNLLALRVNLSIALPCMVHFNETKNDPIGGPNVTTTSSSDVGCVRPPPSNTTDKSNLQFQWTGETKGIVNGAFFFGYLFFQIPSALLANRFGAKRVIMALMILSSLSNLAQHPFALLLGRDAAHWSFIILRFLNGLGLAEFFPVYGTILIGNWAPPLELSRMYSTAMAGANVGIVILFAAGGFICKTVGWPALFYIPGGISLVWLLLFLVLAADTPEKHRWISASERDYILASQAQRSRQRGPAREQNSNSARPLSNRIRSSWILICSVLTSPCVLALWATHVVSDLCDFTFASNIPSFIDEVLYLNIETNGLFSALPYVFYWVVITGLGFAVDLLLTRKLLPLLFVRKTVNTIGLTVSVAVVCLLALTDCSHPVWALVILIVAVSFQGFCYSGFMVNYVEVAGRYDGILYAIGNTLSALAGFVAQVLVGWATSNHTHAEWSVVFFVTAGVTIVGTLIYLIFARADLQPWARNDQGPEVEPVAANSEAGEPHNNSACAGSGDKENATKPLIANSEAGEPHNNSACAGSGNGENATKPIIVNTN